MISLLPRRSLRLGSGPLAASLLKSRLSVLRTSLPASRILPTLRFQPFSTSPHFHQENKPTPAPISDNGLVSRETWTVPNILTMTRIASTPFIGYFIATGHSTAAISVFMYSCITDFIDGFLARRYNMKSVLGSILDPAADKFLMTVCTGALAWQCAMPWYAAGAILGRDVLLSLLAFQMRYTSLPPPKTLHRFLDMSITTHTVHPNMLGKVNTALQMVYIGGLVLAPGLEQVAGTHDLSHDIFHWFGLLVTATTITSGLSYVTGKNAAKLISNSK